MEPDDTNNLMLLCRLCGTFSDNMIDVLDGSSQSRNGVDLLDIIHNCLPVQVLKSPKKQKLMLQISLPHANVFR